MVPEFLRNLPVSKPSGVPVRVLSKRETEVLHGLSVHRFLFQPHLVEFIFGSSDVTPRSKIVMTQRILDGLRRGGLIAATQRLIGGPGGGSSRVAYYLTAQGYRIAASFSPGLPSRRRPPVRGTFLLGHAAMTADVALAFRRAARSHAGHELVDWACDWQTALRLGSSKVLPDAYLVYRSAAYELTAFVEVDMGTEGTRFFGRKIGRYLDLYGHDGWRTHLRYWPLVLTIVPDATRATALRLATEAVLESRGFRADDEVVEFRFAALADVIGAPGPIGTIWQVALRDGMHPLAPDGDADQLTPNEAARVASEPGQPLAPGKEPNANLNNRNPELPRDA